MEQLLKEEYGLEESGEFNILEEEDRKITTLPKGLFENRRKYDHYITYESVTGVPLEKLKEFGKEKFEYLKDSFLVTGENSKSILKIEDVMSDFKQGVNENVINCEKVVDGLYRFKSVDENDHSVLFEVRLSSVDCDKERDDSNYLEEDLDKLCKISRKNKVSRNIRAQVAKIKNLKLSPRVEEVLKKSLKVCKITSMTYFLMLGGGTLVSNLVGQYDVLEQNIEKLRAENTSLEMQNMELQNTIADLQSENSVLDHRRSEDYSYYAISSFEDTQVEKDVGQEVILEPEAASAKSR